MAATLINSMAQTEENQIPGAESSIGKYHVTIPSISSVVAYFSSVARTHPVVPQKPNRYFPGLPMYQPLGAWVRNFGVPTHIGHRVAIFEFKWRDYTIQIWVAGKDKI